MKNNESQSCLPSQAESIRPIRTRTKVDVVLTTIQDEDYLFQKGCTAQRIHNIRIT